MPRTPFSTITPLAGALVLALLTSTPALAAELAEPSVRSYQGQQLSADIELVSLGVDEADGVQVRLAQPNVYQGANVAMHPALRGVHLSVVRRDGRQFLHMTTLQPVDADHLIVFFEIGPAGRQEVRSATLWLQPDPHPAPPPAPVPVDSEASAPVADAALIAARARAARPAPAAVPRARPSAAPESAPVAPSAVAKSAAQASAAASAGAPMATAGDEHAAAASPPVAKRVAPRDLAAAINGKQKASGSPAPAPAAASASASSTAEAAPLPTESKSAHTALKAASMPAAACPSRPMNMSASECAVLDAHNVVLVTKLGLLEAKVHKLQQEIEPAGAQGGEGKDVDKVAASGAASTSGAAPSTGPAAASATLASGMASAPGGAESSASASAAQADASASMHTPQKNGRILPKLKYKKDKEKPPESGASTTLLVAGGVAAAAVIGLLGWLFWKRRKASQGNAPLKIWQGWRKKKTEPAQEPEPAQPLEEVMPESLLEPE